MKKGIMLGLMFVFVSTLAFAEASFDQIQGLIKAQNYSAAVAGLEVIIKNHPKSAKAFYAMSQAQAGIGDQVKAQKALNIATGLDPELKFASSGNVEKLKEAIQPQTQKIVAIESHGLRNTLIVLVILGGIGAFFYFRKKKEDVVDNTFGKPAYTPDPMPVKGYIGERGHEGVAGIPTPPSIPQPHVKVIPAPEREYRPSFQDRQYQRQAAAPAPAPVHHTTVVNNSNNDMLTGVLVGSMLSGSGGHNHNHSEPVRERVVEREPEPSYHHSSPEPVEERSSSWDDDRSSSSSSSSSSWDSGSSSSDSSWDSGSSSSDSSSSSSSWD